MIKKEKKKKEKKEKKHGFDEVISYDRTPFRTIVVHSSKVSLPTPDT